MDERSGDLAALVTTLLDEEMPIDAALLATMDREALSTALRAAVAGLDPAEQRVRLAAAFQRLSVAERS